jgi:hypothetical protein
VLPSEAARIGFRAGGALASPVLRLGDPAELSFIHAFYQLHPINPLALLAGDP